MTIVLKNKFKVVLGLIITMSCSAVFAQQPAVENDTIKIFDEIVVFNEPDQKYPKFKVGGVFQARFLDNFKKGVDINGNYFES